MSLFANVKLDPNQNAGWSVVASNKPLWETAYGFELQFVGNGNANILQLWGSGTDTCQSSNLGIKDGNWHRIGFVVNGTVCHIYVDGADVTKDGVITPIVGSTDPLGIGNNVLNQNGWFGEIDELAIYLNSFMYYQLENYVDNLKSCQVIEPTTTTTTGSITGTEGTTTGGTQANETTTSHTTEGTTTTGGGSGTTGTKTTTTGHVSTTSETETPGSTFGGLTSAQETTEKPARSSASRISAAFLLVISAILLLN
jgi:hypothetical protein